MHWIETQLYSKSISNYNLMQCHEWLGDSICLYDWLFVSIGKKEGVRCCSFFSFDNYVEPLRGEHVIVLYTFNILDSKIVKIKVDSLSFFRQHILGFQDRLSFERSTFIICHKAQKLIRLKCIRSLLHYKKQSSNCFHSKLSFRTKTQFIKNIEQILTSYLRDYQPYYSETQIRQKLIHDIIHLLSMCTPTTTTRKDV